MNEIEDYINKKILSSIPELKSCWVHKLPEYMEKDIELLFKISSDLSNNERDDLIDLIQKSLNIFKYNFLIILSKF